MDTNGIDTIQPIPPEEDKAFLLVSELEHLKSLNIKDFNYYMFEEDLDKMSPGEFEWWFEHAFEPWLQMIEDIYMDIEYEEVKNFFKKQEEKRLFLKKIVHFIMFFLPYQIIRGVINSNDETEDIYDLLEYTKDMKNLINLRSDIINVIENSMIQTDNFVEALANFEKISKKNLLDTSVELLDEHIKKQNFFLNIFKEIILNSDMEKITELLEAYASADARNI